MSTTAPPVQHVESGNYFVVQLEESERKNWAQAEQYCKTTFGTNLASAHSEGEMIELFNLCKYNYCWIGLNDIAEEGKFVWSDGSSFDDFLMIAGWVYGNNQE